MEDKLKQHIVYENNGIDLRLIKCGCKTPECKVGISFESHPHTMRLHDKYGNEHNMTLSMDNVTQLIDYLVDIRELELTLKQQGID